ncbi:MAG: HNH endonuclease [Erysipelotrichales bacterium]|jgi:putative restriction endonuclease|nr:HNH endonuclease [Erysipelotrichales bacterium]
MEIDKYFTKWLLIEYNNAAIRENRNRQLKEDYLDNLPDDIIMPIILMFYHTRDEIRVQIILNKKGNTGFLDMSFERYEMLPQYKKDTNGNFIFETDEQIRKRFPYKNREWTQKVIKKPYRKQSAFRKLVLEVYDNQCAICGVREPKILRAAHIVPVAKGGNDKIENGLCLCTNHEIAYDQGLIKITMNGDIELYSDSLNISNTKILYPSNQENYPSKKYLNMKYTNNY